MKNELNLTNRDINFLKKLGKKIKEQNKTPYVIMKREVKITNKYYSNFYALFNENRECVATNLSSACEYIKNYILENKERGLMQRLYPLLEKLKEVKNDKDLQELIDPEFDGFYIYTPAEYKERYLSFFTFDEKEALKTAKLFQEEYGSKFIRYLCVAAEYKSPTMKRLSDILIKIGES